MQRNQAKTMMEYYGGIADMISQLQGERADLENQHYNAMGAAAADGMPHAGTPGKPVESMAINAAEKGVGERLREIDTRLEVLRSDAATIRGCLDCVNGRYKRILSMRYLHRYSWGKIAVRLEAPDSTARSWHEKALDAIGEALDGAPMIDGVLARASRARV